MFHEGTTAIHGCTVIACNYEAHARVLAETFLSHHLGSTFSVLVVDDPQRVIAREQPWEVLAPADVGIDGDELHRRATMYETQGLVASMKPNLLLELLSRECGPVILLDADGCVYGDLTGVAELAEQRSLVLSPHSLDPYPPWDLDGPEQIIFRAGVMNAGFLGVGAGAPGFLKWWAGRTARRCVFDEQHGLMLAQTWLTLATALFDHHVLRDRGCNVAGWNLLARDVAWDGDSPKIDGEPLRHFHFAGSFDPERPELLTTIEAHARWWPALADRPGTARLARDYAERLIAHDFRRARSTPSPYRATAGGTPIESWMRASYRAALVEAERKGVDEPPNPFSHGDERFLAWVEQRAAEHVERRSMETETKAEISAGARELTSALVDRRQLLARIDELERIRDDAVRWAERAAADLADAKRAIAARDALLRELGTRFDELAAQLTRHQDMMESVWRSPSWRLTKPLRLTKSIATRLRARASRGAR
jgi:hypothetical protein